MSLSPPSLGKTKREVGAEDGEAVGFGVVVGEKLGWGVVGENVGLDVGRNVGSGVVGELVGAFVSH